MFTGKTRMQIFIINMSLEEYNTKLTIYQENRAFCILDPMEGKEILPLAYTRKESGTEIELHFNQGQAYLLVFDQSLPKPETDKRIPKEKWCN